MLTSQLFAVIQSRTLRHRFLCAASEQQVGEQRERGDQQRQGEERHRAATSSAPGALAPARDDAKRVADRGPVARPRPPRDLSTQVRT
jgi:hypothetical protein